MSSPQMKMVAIARLSDSHTQYTESVDKSRTTEYSKEINPLLTKIKEVQLSPHEGQKVKSVNGAWYTLADTRKIFYMVLVDATYPEKYAYDMIGELINDLQKNSGYDREDDLSMYCKKICGRLLKKYNDVSSLDRFNQVRENADKAKDVMSENIKMTLENRQHFEELDSKAEEFKHLSHDFYKDSYALQKKMAQRNRKLMIYGGICAGICVLFLIIKAM